MKSKLTAMAVTTAVMFGLSAPAMAAWEGTWKVKDTDGKPFEITIKPLGVAEATRGDGMVGVWTAKDDTLYLSWNTGWKGKIVRGEDGYEKMAYAPGVQLRDDPTNRSKAEKVE